MRKIQMKQCKSWSSYINMSAHCLVRGLHPTKKMLDTSVIWIFAIYKINFFKIFIYLNDLKSSTNSTKLIVLSEIMRFWKPLKQPLPRPCHDLLLHALKSRKCQNVHVNQTSLIPLDSAVRVIPWLCFHCSWKGWGGLWARLIGASHAGRRGGGRRRGLQSRAFIGWEEERSREAIFYRYRDLRVNKRMWTRQYQNNRGSTNLDLRDLYCQTLVHFDILLPYSSVFSEKPSHRQLHLHCLPVLEMTLMYLPASLLLTRIIKVFIQSTDPDEDLLLLLGLIVDAQRAVFLMGSFLCATCAHVPSPASKQLNGLG